MKQLVWMIRIRRVEFRIAEIPILLIPVLLTIRDASPFRSFAFWEGVFLFFLLFAFGDVINCLADRDVDAKYKKHLSEAIYGLGVRNVKIQLWVMGIVAMGLAAHLGAQLQRWILVPCVAVGLFLGFAYSAEPLRLKARGVWNFLCVWAVVFVGPMLLAAWIVADMPSPEVLAVAATFGLIQEGIIQVNSAEDYFEDLESGVRTMIIALGLHRAIAVAFAAVAVGGAALLGAFAWAFHRRPVAPLGWLALLPLVVAWLAASASVGGLRRSIAGLALDESVARVKKAGKLVPLWLTLVAWASLGASLAVSLS
ncbi:MAG TPA: UbiA family prenyltransferase [Planctomycetota bacterium]|nr:UbiA family prenyltransferase [Planctomycetota bacterium]